MCFACNLTRSQSPAPYYLKDTPVAIKHRAKLMKLHTKGVFLSLLFLMQLFVVFFCLVKKTEICVNTFLT